MLKIYENLWCLIMLGLIWASSCDPYRFTASLGPAEIPTKLTKSTPAGDSQCCWMRWKTSTLCKWPGLEPMNLGNGSRDVSKFHDPRGAGYIYIYMCVCVSLSKLAECHNVSVLQIANNINNPVMSQKYGSHQCCFRPSFENTHFFSRARNSFSEPTGSQGTHRWWPHRILGFCSGDSHGGRFPHQASNPTGGYQTQSG